MKLKITYEMGHPKICPLCGGNVSYLSSHKYTSGYMYSCDNCHAQVGTYKTHPDVAMGVIADSETRQKRIEVHRLFDRFWRKPKGRERRYQELANELGVERDNCHFAYFNLETLLKAEQILLRWWREKYDK